MRKIKTLFVLAAAALMATSCGESPVVSSSQEVISSQQVVSSSVDKYAGLTGTALAVAKASDMTYDELKAASKAEMEASSDTFKVLGLTSVLAKAVTAMSKEFSWIKVDTVDENSSTVAGNTYVKNDYKDYTLLTALDPAATTYVADFALTQDERSIADYTKSGILHNYVPSDYASTGLAASDTDPLKGIHFNKTFWTNTNFTAVTGETLYNIWQLAGSASDAHHLSKVSFQNPQTEQINMSFLISCMADENQSKFTQAYKDFYGVEWANGSKYLNAGSEWVEEFIANISRFHSSDGTAMKETQLKDDWEAGYVYFGAYSKMKDAAGKYYDCSSYGSSVLDALAETEGDNAGKVQAMKTVKWDWDIDGFNGYFYTMDSQIVNNAKHPYTACLFARYILEGKFYISAIYNSSTPNADGSKGNQYGYYFPGNMPAYGETTAADVPTTNSYDWSKVTWKERSICENYEVLKSTKATKVAYISGLIATQAAKIA